MGYVFCMLKIEIAKNAWADVLLDGSLSKALPHGQSAAEFSLWCPGDASACPTVSDFASSWPLYIATGQRPVSRLGCFPGQKHS